MFRLIRKIAHSDVLHCLHRGGTEFGQSRGLVPVPFSVSVPVYGYKNVQVGGECEASFSPVVTIARRRR
jgi:hypothetical protein